MSTHKVEEAIPAASQAEVNSPNKRTTATPSHTGTGKAPVGGVFRLHAEAPSIQRDIVPEILHEATDLPAAGNFEFNLELREDGNSIWTVPRKTIVHMPVQVTLNVKGLWDGAKNTIKAALDRYFRLKTGLSDADYESRANSLATQLANGCSLVTYLKTRALVMSHAVRQHDTSRLRRPRAKTDLLIPKAFAFAIQQIGIVNVADMETVWKAMPIYPETGHRSGIPLEESWNPNKYSEAVEYARNLGMQFAVVDLDVKGGTAWWLLRQTSDDEVFDLSCILPEVNYTESMVTAHMLYCNGEDADPTNAIADLSAVDTGINYGILLTNPHPGFNVTAFQALSDTDAEVWINA